MVSNNRTLRFGIIVCAMVPVLLALGCRTPTYRSQWIKPEWVAGEWLDWYSVPAYRVDKPSGTVCLANDSNMVFLRFFSPDRGLAGRLTGQGLTLWLSNTANKTQKLGIHFPIGMMDGGRQRPSNRFLPNANMPPSETFDMMRLQNNNLEVFLMDSSLSGRKTPDQAEQLGLRADFAEAADACEYRLRISTSGLMDWIKPGSRLLIVMESPKLDLPKRRDFERFEPGEGRGEMPPGGDWGGGGPRGHGRFGGEKGEQKRGLRPDEPLKIRFYIEMASRRETP